MSDLNGKYLTIKDNANAGQQVVITKDQKEASSWKFEEV